MARAAAIVYKPYAVVLGALGGAVAGAVFRRVWKAVGGAEDAPGAKDEHRGWPEVLVAAALQGAIHAAVKAAADRGGAVAFRRATGTWPA